MITVLGRRNSANVQKVMWALGELQIPYVREDVGGSFGYPDGYPNPNSVVPTILDATPSDKIVVWESNACVRYLARTYGQTSLWPVQEIELATADMWMEWQRSDISAAFFPLFQMLVRGLASTPEKIERLTKQCGACFQQLDKQLAQHNYICGKELTMADIAIGAMMFRYMTLPIERPILENMQAWYQRLEQRPAFQKHVMIEYGSNVDEWNTHEQANAKIQ